jgi:hypothetical protein
MKLKTLLMTFGDPGGVTPLLQFQLLVYSFKVPQFNQKLVNKWKGQERVVKERKGQGKIADVTKIGESDDFY